MINMGLPWNDLYEIASEQKGYFLTQQAIKLGISAPLLSQKIRKNQLESVHQGIYRFTQFPASDNEDLMIIWLWSKKEGVFSHETALSIYDISDVLPSKIYITLPLTHSRRRTPPKGVIVYFDLLEDKDITWYEEFQITKIKRTLMDLVIKKFDQEIIEQAITTGIQTNLFTLSMISKVLSLLYKETVHKFNFTLLNQRTRRLMIDEVELACQNNEIYYSSRFTSEGLDNWVSWLIEAVRFYDEEWLREKIKQGGAISHKPSNAAEVFADAQFNRFYVAAICRRALEDDKDLVRIYRAKEHLKSRVKSKKMDSRMVNAERTLKEARSVQLSFKSDLFKPNAGLSVEY